jgi:tetratricopeptide (TPR) repeat protein
MVATLLEQAALLHGPGRAELVRDSIELAEQSLGERELTRAVVNYWGGGDRGSYEAVLILAQHADEAGALHLARAMLDALLEADDSLTLVQQGRIIARRARVDGKLGDIDTAVDQYKRVAKMGTQTGSAELKALAFVGLGALAQMRGNYPQLERFARRAAHIADRHELRALSRHAHNGAMIAAGARHDFATALKHAAAVYGRANGDAIEDAETLQNIGQLLLEAGHSEPAAAAFMRLVSLPLPARILLPALGGLALASSRSRAVDRTIWAAREVQRLHDSTVPRFPLASALLECAQSLALVGEVARSRTCIRVAVDLAERHGFFEVSVKAERMTIGAIESAPERQPLGKPGSRLARELVDTQPAGLPERAMLVAAASA